MLVQAQAAASKQGGAAAAALFTIALERA